MLQQTQHDLIFELDNFREHIFDCLVVITILGCQHLMHSIVGCLKGNVASLVRMSILACVLRLMSVFSLVSCRFLDVIVFFGEGKLF